MSSNSSRAVDSQPQRQHRPPVGDRPAAQPRPDKASRIRELVISRSNTIPTRGNLAEQAFGDHRTKLHRKDAGQNEP
jgi:hypothetical protein